MLDIKNNPFRLQFHGHPDDNPLNSSLNEMIGFKKGHCWGDVVDWIDDKIDYLKNQLINAKSMEEVIGLQASIKILEDVKSVPDLFIQELESLKEEQNKEDSNG